MERREIGFNCYISVSKLSRIISLFSMIGQTSWQTSIMRLILLDEEFNSLDSLLLSGYWCINHMWFWNPKRGKKLKFHMMMDEIKMRQMRSHQTQYPFQCSTTTLFGLAIPSNEAQIFRRHITEVTSLTNEFLCFMISPGGKHLQRHFSLSISCSLGVTKP